MRPAPNMLRRGGDKSGTWPARWGIVLFMVAWATVASGCATQGLRAAVSMKVKRAEDTPKTALVYIDEQYIGTLSYVAARGVRLPEGRHRISVEKAGYFPFDTVVVSDREPIFLEVALTPIPD